MSKELAAKKGGPELYEEVRITSLIQLPDEIKQEVIAAYKEGLVDSIPRLKGVWRLVDGSKTTYEKFIRVGDVLNIIKEEK